jgi:hypothetical protein
MESTWTSGGFHVDSMWIPYGIHVSKYMIYVVKHIPCGFHVDSMWIPWIPCGFHVDSMDSTWNKSVPHGFHVECGGMVKYCQDRSRPEILKTDQDRNRGPVFGPSPFSKIKDRAKTGLSGLNRFF